MRFQPRLEFLETRLAPAVVTPTDTPTAGDNNFTRLQAAIGAATDGETIDIQGTFDWTESNAAASYDASIANSSTADIRGVRLPDGVNNLTITSSTNNAHIIGRGDYSSTNIFDAFLFANDSPTATGNANLIVEKLNIDDFEAGITFGWNATGVFNGTKIRDNTITLGGDNEGTQNIALYFWIGSDQQVTDNTINYQGDGTRTVGSSGARSIGFQNGTTGGTGYDGLLIDNNVFQLANTSTGMEIANGVWENGHNDDNNSHITITNNEFLGRGGDVFDRALVLSSQTSNLLIDGNTFTDVDNVFYIDDFAGPSVGDNFSFSNNVLTRVGGADGVFLRNVSTGGVHVGINWNINNTIDGFTGVRGLNELSTQATGSPRLAGAATDLSVVNAIGPVTTAVVYDHVAATGRFTDPDGIGAGVGPVAVSFNHFTSIQAGINAVDPDGTVQVADGKYFESNIIVTKAVTIVGQSRAGVIVAPAFVDGHSDTRFDGTVSNAFVIRSSDVTIQTLTIDGNGNLGFPNKNFRHAVIADVTLGNFNNTKLHDLAVKNIYRRGVDLRPLSAHTTGNEITNSTFDAVGLDVVATSGGYAIAIFESDTVISDNVITNSGAGVGTNYVLSAAYAPKVTIQRNNISGVTEGLGLSGLADGSVIGGSIANANTISGSGTGSDGIILQYATGLVTIDHNDISGFQDGIYLFNLDQGGAPSHIVSNNTIHAPASVASSRGIHLSSSAPFDGDNGLVNANLSGNTITGYETGISVVQGSQSVAVTFGTGNSVTGGTTGLLVNGANSTIVGATLSNLAFNGQTGNYITLTNAAMDNVEIDGTAAAFGGLTGSAATVVQNFAIEDKITHAVDDASLGFIRVKAGNVFVTQNSGSIQRGVDAASPGETVNVANGTYLESNITIDKNLIVAGQSKTGVIVAPALEDSHDNSTFGGTVSNGFLIQSGGVTIQNLTVDGNDNDALLGDHNFRAGIITDHRLATLYNDITVQDVVVQHTFRRGIQIFSGVSTKSSGHLIDGNTVDDVTLGPGIAIFDAEGTISNNQVSGMASAIESVQVSTTGGSAVTIKGNTLSNVDQGITVVVPGAGTVIGGPTLADRNTITTSGVFDGFTNVGITVRNATGTVFVENNEVIGTGSDAGLWMFGNGDVSHPVLVTNNLFTATTSSAATAGLATGIFMSDDGRLFPNGDGDPVPDLPTFATIAGNTIAGFAIGVDLYNNGIAPSAGGQLVSATIGGATAAGSNSISGGTTGIRVFDAGGATNGYMAVANVQGNATTITGNVIGIDVSGGKATITSNAIYDNTTGIRLTNGGSASVNDSDFNDPGTSGDNDTDLRLDSNAGTLTSLSGNNFAGDAYFIDNRSSQNLNLVGSGNTFEGLSPGTLADSFQIEDHMFHKLDAAASGLIGWNAAQLYVSTPGTGASDETIQRAVDAASVGDTIHVAAGVFDEAVGVNKAVILLGAQAGVPGYDPSRPAALESVITGVVSNGGVAFSGSGATLDGFIVDQVDSGYGAGVWLSGSSSGNRIANNIIRNNTIGLSLASNGVSQTVIQGNLFQTNNLTGPASGDAIYGDSSMQNMLIDSNKFLGNNVAMSLVSSIYGPTFGPVTDLTITNNILDGSGTGGGFGISGQAQYWYPGAPATNLVFSGNTIGNLGAGRGALLVVGVDNASILNNEITGAGNAIDVQYASTNVMIAHNILTGNNRGVYVAGWALRDQVTVTDNAIYGNTTANLENATGTDDPSFSDIPVNAPNNWWGDASGPYNAATNPGGLAPGVSDFVDYSPWLTTGTDTSAAPGFQGDFSQLTVNATSPQVGATGRIQEAIDSLTDGALTGGARIVNVLAGAYAENVIINKALTLAGAGQGASIVRPAVSSITDDPLTGSAIMRVQSSDVHIIGFTLDGDNTAITSGITRGGADIDATAGIVTAYNVSGDYDNLEIDHVTAQNIYLRGIQARMTGAFNIHDNVVDNVQGDVNLSIGIFNRNGGGIISGNTVSRTPDAISANHSRGTQFLNNIITHSQSGIHTDNSRDSGGASTDLIEGNSVSLGDRMGALTSYGIWAFVPYQNVTIHNNTVSGVDIGIGAYGQGSAAGTVTIDHNSVDLGDTAGSIGVDISTTIPFGFGTANVSASLIDGNSVSNAATGVSIHQDPGLVASVSITGTTFTGNDLDIVNQSAGTLTPAGNNVFDGVTLSAATTSQLFALSDKIVDAIDVSGYGLVSLKAGNIYVTPNSFFAPGGTTTADIQRAVDSATTGDTVHIKGGSYTGTVSSSGKAITFDIGAGPALVTLNGNLTLDTADKFLVDIVGTGAGIGFDQLNVTGSVTLGGSTLVFNPGANVPLGSFVIINNVGTNAVIGTFASLPEGSIITAADGLRITYVSGTGNDVAITKAGFTPAEPNPAANHGRTFKPGQAQYADVNGDGKADLIFQNNRNDFFLSLGTSTGFAVSMPVMNHGGTFKPGQAQYADVSGDGKADLIFQGNDNSFWLSLSIGAGFAAPMKVAHHGGTFKPGQAQYADVSGDGKADLIFQGNDNSFWLSLSIGAGFAAPMKVAHHGGTFKPGQAQYADVNGDGKADLIFQNNRNDFFLSLGTSTGFAVSMPVMNNGGTFKPGQAHYADVNGDGKADLMFQGLDNKFWMSLSHGAGFDPAQSVVDHSGAFKMGQAQYADVSGDGKADLMFQGLDNKFWMSLSHGAGFDPAQWVVDHSGAFKMGQAQYADVNGDSVADLILQDQNNDFWLWFAVDAS